MKRIAIILGVVSVQFTFANSIIESVQNSKECGEFINKAPKNATAKYCQAVYNYGLKLNSYPSYRSLKRMELLRKVQKISKNIHGDTSIQNGVNQELEYNHQNLKSIWWPHNKLNYLDVELKNNKLSLLYNKMNNSTIQYGIKSLTRVSSKKGKKVMICTEKNTCERIQDNIVRVKQGLSYTRIKILTEQGTFEQVFRKTGIKNLIGLAYEINAQLYNQQAPSLSTLSIQYLVPVKQKLYPDQSKITH